MSGDVPRLIDALSLAPHPEGGWYRETLRVAGPQGGRDLVTAIHFLLEEGQQSHWHRVDATEIWCWHAGAGLELLMAKSGDGPVARVRLGGNPLANEAVQAVVPAGHWQAARPLGGWVLVSCVVAPGFRFDGFELAPPGWAPGN